MARSAPAGLRHVERALRAVTEIRLRLLVVGQADVDLHGLHDEGEGSCSAEDGPCTGDDDETVSITATKAESSHRSDPAFSPMRPQWRGAVPSRCWGTWPPAAWSRHEHSGDRSPAQTSSRDGGGDREEHRAGVPAARERPGAKRTVGVSTVAVARNANALPTTGVIVRALEGRTGIAPA